MPTCVCIKVSAETLRGTYTNAFTKTCTHTYIYIYIYITFWNKEIRI